MNLVRVDQIEGLSSLIFNTTNDAVSNYLPLSGGIITGNLRLEYLNGNNLRGLFVDSLGNVIASNDDFPITRIRTNRNAYVSGDITLTAGSNTTLSQNGNIITINSTDSNTTYSAGNGLTLSGTQFSVPVTVNGSGTYVQSVTQTTNGITVTLGTPSDNNTTYTAGSGLTLIGTQFSLPVSINGSGSFVQSVTQTTNGITVTLGTPPNTDTTYSVISVAEVTNPKNNTARLISGQRLTDWVSTIGLFNNLGLHNTALEAYTTNNKNGLSYWSSSINGYQGDEGMSLHLSPIGKTLYTRLDFPIEQNYIEVWRGINTSIMSLIGVLNIIPKTTTNITSDNIKSYLDTTLSTRLRSNISPYLSGDITLTAGSNVTLSQSGNTITINATNTNTDTVTRLRSNTNTLLTGDITLTAGSNVTLSQNGNVITINATNTNTITRLRYGSNSYVSGDITLSTNGSLNIMQTGNSFVFSNTGEEYQPLLVPYQNYSLSNALSRYNTTYVGETIPRYNYTDSINVGSSITLTQIDNSGNWNSPNIDFLGNPIGVIIDDVVLIKGFLICDQETIINYIDQTLCYVYHKISQSLKFEWLSVNQIIEYSESYDNIFIKTLGRVSYSIELGTYVFYFNPQI